MLKVVHEIGEAREISKNNEAIAERDPKHPYNPAHALKNQEDLQKQPIAKIFERWPRYSEEDLKNIPPYPPCFGTPTQGIFQVGSYLVGFMSNSTKI